jgi:hypothetical protein
MEEARLSVARRSLEPNKIRFRGKCKQAPYVKTPTSRGVFGLRCQNTPGQQVRVSALRFKDDGVGLKRFGGGGGLGPASSRM